MTTLPTGHSLWTTEVFYCGRYYGVTFVARDRADAEWISTYCGWPIDERYPGELMAILSDTPDGTVTEWDKDTGGATPTASEEIEGSAKDAEKGTNG